MKAYLAGQDPYLVQFRKEPGERLQALGRFRAFSRTHAILQGAAALLALDEVDVCELVATEE